MQFATLGKNIISDFNEQIKDLSVAYKNKSIQSLTVTKLVLWNAGNETINNTDIPELDSLKITIKNNCKILATNTIFLSDNVNQLKLKNTSSGLKISFDFLDPKDGGIFQIFHTGSSPEDVIISGTIKGIGKINKYNINPKPFYYRSITSNLLKDPTMNSQNHYVTSKLVAVGMLFVSFTLGHLLITKFVEKEIEFVFFILSFFGLFIYFLMALDLLRNRIPSIFRDFYKNNI